MPRRAPWRAQVGWAWWTLCQLSPRDTMASGHRFVLRSAVSSDRQPKVWHSELTDQVTWWRSAIRTRPAHNQGGERADQGPRQPEADPERDGQGRHGQQRKEAVDTLHVAVAQHVGRVACGARRIRYEQPTDVGEGDASQQSRAVVAVAVGRVRVAGVVAEHVVAAMGGHPAGHRSLDGHRAQHGEGDLQGPPRREAAVGEQPVEADCDPEAGDQRRG